MRILPHLILYMKCLQLSIHGVCVCMYGNQQVNLISVIIITINTQHVRYFIHLFHSHSLVYNADECIGTFGIRIGIIRKVKKIDYFTTVYTTDTHRHMPRLCRTTGSRLRIHLQSVIICSVFGYLNI